MKQLYIGVFQANYQDILFFALSQDFDPIKNLLLSVIVNLSIKCYLPQKVSVIGSQQKVLSVIDNAIWR